MFFGFFAGRGLDAVFAAPALAGAVLTALDGADAVFAAAPPALVPPDEALLPAPEPSVLFVVIPA